jgi:tRNA (cytidine/uridine-2'-O-)-methyltransferase
MKRLDRPFHVVLVEPEIPQNTGNIARLCAAVGSPLHLVGKLGFSVDEKAVRRAGLDYWPLVTVVQHKDLSACLSSIGASSVSFFTTKSPRCYTEAPFTPGHALIFGKETKGLPPEVLETYSQNLYSIPTVEDSVRSLNLANAVSIVLFEALRKTGALQNLTEKGTGQNTAVGLYSSTSQKGYLRAAEDMYARSLFRRPGGNTPFRSVKPLGRSP